MAERRKKKGKLRRTTGKSWYKLLIRSSMYTILSALLWYNHIECTYTLSYGCWKWARIESRRRERGLWRDRVRENIMGLWKKSAHKILCALFSAYMKFSSFLESSKQFAKIAKNWNGTDVTHRYRTAVNTLWKSSAKERLVSIRIRCHTKFDSIGFETYPQFQNKVEK